MNKFAEQNTNIFMNKIKLFYLAFFAGSLLVSSCGNTNKPKDDNGNNTASNEVINTEKNEIGSYDPKRGEGKYDETNVKLGVLDLTMADKGESVSSTKCNSCHKLTEEKLVGPGWKGVTSRRTPHWIMNFITNPDPMIDKDPEVQAQLELCLVRMPNQSLTDEDARNILEFMRKNDGVK